MSEFLKIAHRGSHHNYPENTIQAFRESVVLGADAIELDVRISADSNVLVFHDSFLKRLMTQTGSIKQMNYADIVKIPFKENEKCRIPLLTDVIEEFSNKLLINIEIKDINILNHKLTREVVTIIEKMNVFDNVWVSSFNPLVLDLVKLYNKNVRTAFLFHKIKFFPLLLSQFLKFDYWHPHFSIVDEYFIKVAEKRNKKVYPWTVNNADDINRLKSLNVNGIISDDVTIL